MAMRDISDRDLNNYYLNRWRDTHGRDYFDTEDDLDFFEFEDEEYREDEEDEICGDEI